MESLMQAKIRMLKPAMVEEQKMSESETPQAYFLGPTLVNIGLL